jgi:hypothetical protein
MQEYWIQCFEPEPLKFRCGHERTVLYNTLLHKPSVPTGAGTGTPVLRPGVKLKRGPVEWLAEDSVGVQ